MNVLDGIPDAKLTPDQESELALAGDDESRTTLVMHNLREAFHYAKGIYQGRGLEDGVLLSAAYDALACAVKKFKPRGKPFFSYAKAWVRGKVCRRVRAEINFMEPSVRYGDREVFSGLFTSLEIDEPDDDTIASVKASYKPIPAEQFDFHAIDIREQWAKIQPVIAPVISEDERMILELHFFGEMGLREIADLIGVSRSRVQLVKQEALKKMRLELIERGMFNNHEDL